ncbi:hypothetical protein U9M48_041572 [Paspalum notatum var. saurae]|uniref:Uncharacterized protein n=1 Tax=Paspalum notatum var. saurae TaxID=547442 RepID=A0AAQ3XFE5_PASNO
MKENSTFFKILGRASALDRFITEDELLRSAGHHRRREEERSWPEVVGLPAEEAKKIILKDTPGANVVVMPSGSPATMDLRTDRVRVFVNTVAQTPTTSWPELVGLSVEEAKEVILQEKPDADIVVLPAGSPTTRDFRPNRVRIFVDTVAQPPHLCLYSEYTV